MMKISKRARRKLTTAALTILAAWLVALWAIPAAYAERGYAAAGGEWILIAAAGGLVYGALAPRKVRRGGAQGQTAAATDIPIGIRRALG